MTVQPEPHSRWRLIESVESLAGSYDAAVRAIDALARSACGYDSRLPRPGVGARLRAGGRRWVEPRGWLRTAWFVTTSFLAASFMAWTSLRLLRQGLHGMVPAILGMLPGIMLALALSGTAALAAAALAGVTGGGHVPQPRGPMAAALFAVTAAGTLAWVAAWLTWVAGLAAWAALPAALGAVGVLIVALVAASLPLPPRGRPLPAHPQPVRPPRKLLARQRDAQELVRKHARRWSLAAQHCGLAVSHCPAAQAALARLVMDGDLGDVSAVDLETIHAQLLATLSTFGPGLLRARLDEAGQRLLATQSASLANSS